jgi:hypothetical protein
MYLSLHHRESFVAEAQPEANLRSAHERRLKLRHSILALQHPVMEKPTQMQAR